MVFKGKKTNVSETSMYRFHPYLEGPALAGQRAGADHGARAEALAAQERGEHVQGPAHWGLVNDVLRGTAGVQHSAAGRLEREICYLN